MITPLSHAPTPRSGWRGAIDHLAGPGATRIELWLQFGAAITAGLALPTVAVIAQLGWSGVQLAMAGLLAFDTIGGMVTNATHSAKRWFHRPSRTFRDHMIFASSHGIQLLVFVIGFCDGNWRLFSTFYGMLIAGFLLMWAIPSSLQRPVGTLLYAVALLLSMYVFPGPAGMEWFVPLFFLKLMLGHFVADSSYHDVASP